MMEAFKLLDQYNRRLIVALLPRLAPDSEPWPITPHGNGIAIFFDVLFQHLNCRHLMGQSLVVPEKLLKRDRFTVRHAKELGYVDRRFEQVAAPLEVGFCAILRSRNQALA